MHDAKFVTDLGIALFAALLGGLAARACRLPTLIGFLLAGVAIGPYTPGFIADANTVGAIANLGVALLMFAVGVQFSLHELDKVRSTALRVGIFQILGTIGIGALLAWALGWNWLSGLFLGSALALSSTAVMMRILEERGELGTTHGEIMLGILVVQDLSLVLMASLLPALGGAFEFRSIGLAILSAGAFIVATVLIATKLAPPLMSRVAKSKAPELLILTAVCFCLGMAAAAEYAGLGMALGAFLAGVVVSESPFSHEVFSQIRPLRDVFSSLFFVSIGMLLDVSFAASHVWVIAVVLLAIILGKGILTTLAVLWCKWHFRTAVTVGLGLAQIGEFSFVLISLGSSKDLVGDELEKVVFTAALFSLLLAPFLLSWAEPLYRWLSRSPRIAQWIHRRGSRDAEGFASSEVEDCQVLILGAGRVGRYVSDALRAKGVDHRCVDIDFVAVERLRANGVPIVYGDASSREVLKKVHPEQMKLAVVALPESAMTEAAVRHLRTLAPDLPIAARVRRGIDIPRMRAAGATIVVHGEFESGAEMIRLSFEALGFDLLSIEQYIDEVRSLRYRETPEVSYAE